MYVALGRVWLEMAQAHDDRVALAKALEALEGAVEDDDSSEALTLFGRALLLATDDERAERMLQDATTREAGRSERVLLSGRGGGAVAATPNVARQALLDYRTLTGDDRDARRSAALADRLGDAVDAGRRTPQSAATWYQRALDAGGAEVVLLVRLADAQAAAGDPDAARRPSPPPSSVRRGNPAARALARRCADEASGGAVGTTAT